MSIGAEESELEVDSASMADSETAISNDSRPRAMRSAPTVGVPKTWQDGRWNEKFTHEPK